MCIITSEELSGCVIVLQSDLKNPKHKIAVSPWNEKAPLSGHINNTTGKYYLISWRAITKEQKENKNNISKTSQIPHRFNKGPKKNFLIKIFFLIKIGICPDRNETYNNPKGLGIIDETINIYIDVKAEGGISLQVFWTLAV